MAADRLDVLRDKLFSEADARLNARIAARMEPIETELARLGLPGIEIERGDGSKISVSPRAIVSGVRNAIFLEQRDTNRAAHVTDFLRRVEMQDGGAAPRER